MTDNTGRSVAIERGIDGRFVVRNVRGGSMPIGSGGDDDSFTPVELFLAAIGGCTAIDVDVLTSRRAQPDEFTVTVTANKIRDESGENRLENIRVEFAVTFPEGGAGDSARDVLPRYVGMSHDRICTVTRTVERGTPVSTGLREGSA